MGDPGEGAVLEGIGVTESRDPIAFAEKVLALLELGSFSATYKYALFTAIMDLCHERASASGALPTTLTTRQLAGKVTELYWPHATPYEGGGVLRQGGVRSGNQAEILSAISHFRTRHAGAPGELHFRAQSAHPDAFERLVRKVEWKLIEMPIPRLQRMGREEDRFLYDYGWTEDIRQADVTAYQRGDRSAFDNRLLLGPAVAEHIVTLTGVLRPVVRREWTLMVAGMNALSEAKLEQFLFGSSRVSLDAVRGALGELQGGRCFYCGARVGRQIDVDHFIPWARYPDNGIDNLVAAHPACNNQKRDFFAAAEHLEHWTGRSRVRNEDLDILVSEAGWVRDAGRSRSVARAMYSRLPQGSRVWISGTELVPIDQVRVAAAFR